MSIFLDFHEQCSFFQMIQNGHTVKVDRTINKILEKNFKAI